MVSITKSEPLHLRRHIEFGVVAGIIAGVLVVGFDLNLPFMGALAAMISGWFAARL